PDRGFGSPLGWQLQSVSRCRHLLTIFLSPAERGLPRQYLPVGHSHIRRHFLLQLPIVKGMPSCRPWRSAQSSRKYRFRRIYQQLDRSKLSRSQAYQVSGSAVNEVPPLGSLPAKGPQAFGPPEGCLRSDKAVPTAAHAQL